MIIHDYLNVNNYLREALQSAKFVDNRDDKHRRFNE